MNYVVALQTLCVELVDDKDNLKVVEMPSLDDNEIVLYVYATQKDLAKLIGKKGAMANSIRHLMSVVGMKTKKKVSIHFESYE